MVILGMFLLGSLIPFLLGLFFLWRSWGYLGGMRFKRNRKSNFLNRGYGMFGPVVFLSLGLWSFLISFIGFYGTFLTIQRMLP